MFPGMGVGGGRAAVDENADETLGERLWGLTEMFPEPVQKGLAATASWGYWAVAGGLSLSRRVVWIASTTAMIGALPLMFEKERLEMAEEMKRSQQQFLMGAGPPAAKAPASSVMGAIAN